MRQVKGRWKKDSREVGRSKEMDGEEKEGTSREEDTHLCVSAMTDASPTFPLKIFFKNSHPLPA